MKTIEELRVEFEEIPHIAELLKNGDIYYNDFQNKYQTDFLMIHSASTYVSGAWFMFQELKK